MRIGVMPLSGVEEVGVFAPLIEAAGIESVILHESMNLAEIDGFLLLGSGLLRDLTRDPLLHAIHQQSERGKPVLGVGAGAQLLLALGWVPGLENNKPAIRLIEQQQPAPQFVRLASNYQRNAFTSHTTIQDIYPVTVLDAPLKYFAMSNVLYDEIQHQGLNVWLYCTEKGDMLNNQIENVAAIANKRGNVLAMVPLLTSGAIFVSMRDYLKKGLFSEVAPLNYYPR